MAKSEPRTLRVLFSIKNVLNILLHFVWVQYGVLLRLKACLFQWISLHFLTLSLQATIRSDICIPPNASCSCFIRYFVSYFTQVNFCLNLNCLTRIITLLILTLTPTHYDHPKPGLYLFFGFDGPCIKFHYNIHLLCYSNFLFASLGYFWLVW
jgi:hypothetical protein